MREDELRRGRAGGVGAQLVVEGALAVGFAREHLRVILSEREAVDAALRAARQGDLVVVLVTDVEERWQQIRDFDSSNTPPRDFQSDRQDSRESHRA